MRNRLDPVLPFVALAVLACSRKPNEGTERTQPSASTPPVITAPAPAVSSAPAAAAIPEVTPVCAVESKKVWLKGANTLSGLTEAMLADGRAAIGFAVGNQPHILLVTNAG